MYDDFEKSVSGLTPDKREGLETKEFQGLSVKAVDQENRRIDAIASTGAIDRDDDLIEPSAFKKWLPLYMKNPVVLAGHSHRLDDGTSPVVGKCVDVRIDRKGLHVTIEFADTELGLQYWKLYRDKYQRALSVGFRVHAQGEKYIEGKRVNVITEAELYEISCVAVPCNPEALSKAAKRKQRFVEMRRAMKDAELDFDIMDMEDDDDYLMNVPFEDWPEEEKAFFEEVYGKAAEDDLEYDFEKMVSGRVEDPRHGMNFKSFIDNDSQGDDPEDYDFESLVNV